MIYTIGHSNHDLEKFLCLLEGCSVETVCDVRSSPYSGRCPWFNRESLAIRIMHRQDVRPSGSLRSYAFMGDKLGAKIQDPSMHTGGSVDFDKVAKSQKFQDGISELLDLSKKSTVAIMCSEWDPINCHRLMLICRNLCSASCLIEHIMPDGEVVTQPEIENRLVKMAGLEGHDLMFDFDELVVRAYDIQSKKVAWALK